MTILTAQDERPTGLTGSSLMVVEGDTPRVGALVGMMLGLGYTTAAISPFVLGAVRDLTGSFDAVLWVCVVFLGLLAVLVRLLPAGRARPVLFS